MSAYLKFAIFSIVLGVSIYILGCNSAEETTAMLAFKAGDFQKAEQEFYKEVVQNPKDEEAWYYLGASRLQLKKYDGADTAFKNYRAIGKNTYASEILDAWVKRYNSAADEFEKGQKTKDTKEQLKNFQDAVDDFKVCKVIEPDSVSVDKYITLIGTKIAAITVNPIIDKGIAFVNEGKYEEAVGQYTDAMSKVDNGSPTYEIVSFDLSVAYLKWGEKLRNDNQDDPAYKDKYKAAMPYLEALTGSADKDTKLQAYELLVQVYANLGMNDKAQDAIKMRDQLKSEKDKK